MDADAVRRDIRVAVVAAGTALLTTGVTEFGLSLDLSAWIRATPLYVYASYAFTRKGGPYTRYDTPRAWIALAVVSGLAVVGYGLVG